MTDADEIEYQNGVAEDLGALLGYGAASRLMAWYGGEKIHIPARPSATHALAKLLGMPAMGKLCDEFGGEKLKVPMYAEAELLRKVHAVAQLIQDGARPCTIALALSISEGTVRNYRARAEMMGLLPMVLGRRNVEEDAI